MDEEKGVQGLLLLAALALSVVGLNQALIVFADAGFLGGLPEILQQVTIVGALIGALDNGKWALERLLE